MKVGFIGLGQVDRPMAERLLGAGHGLQVYNRTRAPADVGQSAVLTNLDDYDYACQVSPLPACVESAVSYSSLASLRVLVVDDAVDVAQSMAYLLDEMGHTAEYVTDPRLALHAARKFRPHLILLDLGMPHIDGYQLAPAIRHELRQHPVYIVAVTAYGQPKDREKSRKSGFDAHVQKPVDMSLLESILKTLTNPGTP
jgi:CheY-like chemotaxis protein